MGASLTWITMLQSESVIFHGKATLLHPIIIQSLIPKAFQIRTNSHTLRSRITVPPVYFFRKKFQPLIICEGNSLFCRLVDARSHHAATTTFDLLVPASETYTSHYTSKPLHHDTVLPQQCGITLFR